MARYSKSSERDFLLSLSPKARQQIAEKLGYNPLKTKKSGARDPGSLAVPPRVFWSEDTRPAVIEIFIDGFVAKMSQKIDEKESFQWAKQKEKKRCFKAVQEAFLNEYKMAIFKWRPYEKASLLVVRTSPMTPDDDNLQYSRKYIQDAITARHDGLQIILDDKPSVLVEAKVEARKNGSEKSTRMIIRCLEDDESGSDRQ